MMRCLMLLGLGLAVFVMAGCSPEWQRAERDAKVFAQKIPGATGDVSCAKGDSDGDGYCSCTVFMEDGSMQNLDCGCEKYALWNKKEGCKVVDAMKFQGSDRNRR